MAINKLPVPLDAAVAAIATAGIAIKPDATEAEAVAAVNAAVSAAVAKEIADDPEGLGLAAMGPARLMDALNNQRTRARTAPSRLVRLARPVAVDKIGTDIDALLGHPLIGGAIAAELRGQAYDSFFTADGARDDAGIIAALMATGQVKEPAPSRAEVILQGIPFVDFSIGKADLAAANVGPGAEVVTAKAAKAKAR